MALQIFRLQALGLLLMLFLANLLPAQSKPLETELDKIVRRYHKNQQFDGVILVAQKGKIIYKQSFGTADREWNVPIKLDTKFKIASLTKQFTALLVMQLVEQNKLKLEGTITDYLPTYRKDTGSKITIKQLLNHTSGLPSLDENSSFYLSQDIQLSNPTYVIKTFCSGDLMYEPGEKFNYNNADYIILGAILEQVTDKTYQQLLQTQILQPLNMTSSGLLEEQAVLGQLARGYTYKNSRYVNEPYIRSQNFYASGAMYATLEDLYRWNRALDTYQLLGKSATTTMFTPSKELGYVALGSWVYTLNLGNIKPILIERQGNMGAFQSLNVRVPEQEITLILLSNLENSDLFTIYAKKGLPYELLQAIFSP